MWQIMSANFYNLIIKKLSYFFMPVSLKDLGYGVPI